MRKLVIAIALSMLSGFAAAQEKLFETVEVSVASVDVVVTDRSGKPVTGLTADDFEVLEGRKRQPITNFTEIRVDDRGEWDGRAAAPVVPRRFVVFLDNESLHPAMRGAVIDAVRRFVDRNIQATDEVSVVSWNRGLEVLTPLTSRRASIEAALERARSLGSPKAIRSGFARVRQQCNTALQMARSGRMPMTHAYGECIQTAQGETAESLASSRHLVTALNVMLSSLGSLEGRKALILAGAHLPLKPGFDYFNVANQLFSPFMTGFDKANRQPVEEEREQARLLAELGSSANAHGVTLYLLAAPVPDDAASAVFAGGLEDAGSEFLHYANTDVVFQRLAETTGGVAASRPAQFAAALDTMARDVGSYYSIGYRPEGELRSERSITVRAKNRNHLVRVRQSFAVRSIDERMSDRVVANIFMPLASEELPVRLITGKPAPGEKGNFVVPIEIEIPPILTLIQREDRKVGGFTVYVAVGTPQGALSTLFRQPESVVVPLAEEAAFRSEPLVFSASLTVKPGENIISVGVLDQVSNVAGVARTVIDAR